MNTVPTIETSPAPTDIVRQGSMSGAGASSAGAAVTLLGASTSFSGSTATVDLSFSTTMAKGTGFIYITDGAVQTVIDRATGLPTIRIVGATETRKIAVADVQVSGSHVLVKADGLSSGHQYSVFMGDGVLTSSTLQSFAGVTKPGLVAISVADSVAPTFVSMELSSSVLAAGAAAQLTITFSEPVKTFPGSALQAQGGAIEGLRPVGDGRVWVASVSTPGLTPSTGNKIALDLAQVRDLAGNAGNGTYQSAAYVIDDGKLPTATIALADTTLTAGESVEVRVTLSEPVATLGLDAFSAPHVTLTAPVSIDGGKTWTLTMRAASSDLHHADLKLSLDMSKVLDTAGHAGSGSTLSASYAVDTRSIPDTVGPTVESISFNGDVLDASHDLVATIRFSEKVQAEGLLGALKADYASLSGLASSDGGRTWTVTLKLAEPDAEADIGEFGIRLSQVRDLAGNAGTGVESAPAYAVNTFSSFIFLYDDGYSAEDGLVSVTHGRYFGGILLGDFPAPETSFELTVRTAAGTEEIDNSEIVFYPMDGMLYWYYGGEGSWTEGSHDIVAKARNGDGAVVTTTRHVEVDGTAPLIVESPASGIAPPPFDITDKLVIQFSEAIYFTDDEPQIEVATLVGAETVYTTIAVDPSYLSENRKTLTIPAGVHQLAGNVAVTLTLPGTADLAGNRLEADSFSFATYSDIAAPVAIGAALLGDDANPVTTGGRIMFTITFDEPVTLSGDGERYVNMNNGGKAYVYGASMDGTELTFQYIVAKEDEDVLKLGVRDFGSLVGQLKDAANNVLGSAAVDLGALRLHGDDFLQVDQTAPAILAQPTLALASDSGSTGDYTTSLDKPTILGAEAEAGARILIKVDGTAVTDYVVADSAGKWTWTPSAPIAVGGHTLSVQQQDRAGNLSEARTVELSVDVLPTPQLAEASDHGKLDNDGITKDSTPTYSGTGAVANGIVALFAGGVEVGRTVADSAGAWSVTVADAKALADGSYSITAKLIDADGKVGAVSGAHTIVVDATAPTALAAPKLDADSDSGASRSDRITNDSTPTFTGSGATGNSLVALIVDSVEVGRTTSDASGNYAITSSLLTDGNHQVSVRQFDLAGNQSADSASTSVTIDTKGPTLTDLDGHLANFRFDLTFDEAIWFHPSGRFDLRGAVTNRVYEAGDSGNGWQISGDGTVLSFNISLTGLLKMQQDSVTDLAGNAAIIGVPEWTLNIF